MSMRNANGQKQQGFTLIEAMITVAVLSFGLLAIGSFQAKLVSESAYNKARAEALTLAQAKLDDIRSYSSEHGMVEKLLDNPVPNPAKGAEYHYPANVPAAAASYSDTTSGINADFTRAWTVKRAVTSDTTDQDSLLSNVVVVVSWTDRQGAHNVSLEGNLTWRNPRGTADMEEITTPLVDAPTGKAYLGDGTLTKTEMDTLKQDHPETSNNDGTYTYDHDGDGDLELIVEQSDGSGEVVLTLPDACKVDGGCTDFVQISGSVFFHRKTGNMKYSSLTANDVWVLASDAAYCSRYIPVSVSGTTLTTSNTLTTLPPSGGAIYRNNDAVVDFTGAGINNYEYFNYTCYLGGGWYGNIGLVLLKSTNQDYACVGDPIASDADPDDKWRRVEVAKRRVYRGMLHQYTVDTNGDHVEVTNTSGDTIFYSQGIHDAARYPDPSWAERNQGHDFVISNANSPSVSDCKTVMGVPDANPDAATELSTGVKTANLFHHVSGDFICLNEDGDNSHPGSWAKFLGYPWDYLNTFDTQTRDARLSCPYDPSVPPSKRYTIHGVLAMDTLTDSTWGSGSVKPELKLFEGNINTSDGIDNCRILSTSYASTGIEYECDYYVWSDINLNEFPWNGAVVVNTPNDVVCAPNNPYNVANLGSAVNYPLLNKTGNLTNINFTCKDKQRYNIAGTITTDEGNDLLGTGPQIKAYDVAGVEIAGACSIDTTSSSSMSVVYSCDNLLEPTYLGGFTGKVELTVPQDYSCTSQTSIDGVAGCDSGVVSWSFTDLKAPATSIGNDAVLKGPITVYRRSGTVLNGSLGKASFTTNMFLDQAATDLFVVNETPWSDSCLWDESSIDFKSAGYSCTFTVDSRLAASWSGQVNIIPKSGWICGGATATAVIETTVPPIGTLPDVTCNLDTSDFVSVKGSVFVYAPYTGSWDYVDVGAGNGSYEYGPTTYYDYVGVGGDYVYDSLTGTFTLVAAGSGDYQQVVIDDYYWVGAGFGTYEWQQTYDDLVTLSAKMTGGSCTFDRVPSVTSTEKQWYDFNCKTDTEVDYNATWSGSITITTNEPPWEQCQLNGYTNTYSGVPPGTVIDNAFRAVDFPSYCADYAGAGPWLWIPYPSDLPDNDPNGLPWTPTYP